jgi:hypothetical protein
VPQAADVPLRLQLLPVRSNVPLQQQGCLLDDLRLHQLLVRVQLQQECPVLQQQQLLLGWEVDLL